MQFVEKNGQKLPNWMAVRGLLSLRKEINTAQHDKYQNKTFNVERTKTWRKNLNLLHDTAFCNNEDKGTLSADIALVAYGIAKHVTFIKLSKFLEGKGLDVYAIASY